MLKQRFASTEIRISSATLNDNFYEMASFLFTYEL